MITLIIPPTLAAPCHIPCPALEQHNYLCTNTGDLMREQIRNRIAVSHSRLLFAMQGHLFQLQSSQNQKVPGRNRIF